jgi:hypothetical protein
VAQKRSLSLAPLVLAILFPVLAAASTDSQPLHSRLRSQFPLAAHSIGAEGPQAVALPHARSLAQAADETSSLAIDMINGRTRVVLRPSSQRNAVLSATADGIEGRGVFNNVDILRTGSNEVLFLTNRAAARAIVYDVVRSEGIRDVLSFGRSVRFLGMAGADLTLAAPLVIDASGRPSFGAKWVVEHTELGTSLRLRVMDRGLRYPAVVTFGRNAPTAALRPFVPTTNAIGAVAGTITDQGNGNPIEGAVALLYDSAGEFVNLALTDSAGDYTIDSLETGSYRALFLAEGFDAELYDGIDCADLLCSAADGTSIDVVDGSTTNIDVALSSPVGRISGRVTANGGAPIGGVTVQLYDSSGDPAGGTLTDSETGEYLLLVDTAGTYFAKAVNTTVEGLIDQVYSGVDCNSCDPTSGAPITVTSGAKVGNIDFALRAGGRIAGTVLDENGGGPITTADLSIYDSAGVLVSFGRADPNGAYTSFHGLSTGQYYVVAQAATYHSELYDDARCAGCSPVTGTPVAVTSPATTTGINFVLTSEESRVSGTVRDAVSGLPLENAYVTFFDSQGEHVQYTVTDATGDYTISLPTGGTYFAKAQVYTAPGYVDQLYGALDCSGCLVTSGTPIDVVPGSPVEDIDFSLAKDGGKITGRILDATDSTPVDFGYVLVYSSTGGLATYGFTDGNGNYETFNSLTSGSYFVVGQSFDRPAELYDDIDCHFGCDPTTGSPVAVTRGNTTAGIDFGLTTPACTIELEPSVLPGGDVGDAYSQVLTSPDGVAPLTFTIASGSLPDGLALDGTSGAITGSLAEGGTFAFTAVVTDANGCEGGRTYIIEVSISQSGTTTTLTSSPAAPAWGTNVVLTATVAPAAADGTISFFDGVNPEPIGTATLVNGVGSMSISTLEVGTHQITASYGGSESYGASSDTESVTISKRTPVITWSAPLPITYGSALSAAELNATADVAGTFVYTPAEGTILDAGTYTLSASFTPADTAHYNGGSASVPLLVNKADQQIAWSDPSPIVFGSPLTSTQLNAVVFVVGPAPAGALTYNPPAGTILNAGSNTLTANVAGTNNYNPATASVTVVVGPASGAFSNLSAPTILVGTPSTVISGKISSGSLIPPGSVTITIASTSLSAPIAADGTFSATFNTASLQPVTPGYTITFSYPGSTNFAPATDTSLLIVVYGMTGGPLQQGAAKSGSVIPMRVSLRNVGGANISTSSLAVTAYGVRLTTSATWIPVTSTGNSSTAFEFQNAQGGSYFYNLDTDGLVSGSYVLGITIGSDPVVHTVSFSIKP